MVSVASGGTADRIAARILFKVLRAGSGTPATYSSTFFGALLPFAAELRIPRFHFFHAGNATRTSTSSPCPNHRAALRHEVGFTRLRPGDARRSDATRIRAGIPFRVSY